MGIRDEEIKRLIKYAQGLGVQVSFLQGNTYDSAQWYIDGSKIEVFTKKNETKVKLILSLVHEIAHQVCFIHEKDRKEDKRFREALIKVDEDKSTKKDRKIILDFERASTMYWEIIYKETNLKFPIWKLHQAKEYDIWMYEYFYENGEFPGAKLRKQKNKELKEKYKNT